MMFRAIGSPRPVPVRFVVKYGSKIVRHVFGRDAAAAVTDADVRPGRRATRCHDHVIDRRGEARFRVLRGAAGVTA